MLGLGSKYFQYFDESENLVSLFLFYIFYEMIKLIAIRIWRSLPNNFKNWLAHSSAIINCENIKKKGGKGRDDFNLAKLCNIISRFLSF